MKSPAEVQAFWLTLQSLINRLDESSSQPKLVALLKSQTPPTEKFITSTLYILGQHLHNLDPEVRRLTRLAINFFLLKKQDFNYPQTPIWLENIENLANDDIKELFVCRSEILADKCGKFDILFEAIEQTKQPFQLRYLLDAQPEPTSDSTLKRALDMTARFNSNQKWNDSKIFRRLTTLIQRKNITKFIFLFAIDSDHRKDMNSKISQSKIQLLITELCQLIQSTKLLQLQLSLNSSLDSRYRILIFNSVQQSNIEDLDLDEKSFHYTANSSPDYITALTSMIVNSKINRLFLASIEDYNDANYAALMNAIIHSRVKDFGVINLAKLDPSKVAILYNLIINGDLNFIQFTGFPSLGLEDQKLLLTTINNAKSLKEFTALNNDFSRAQTLSLFSELVLNSKLACLNLSLANIKDFSGEQLLTALQHSTVTHLELSADGLSQFSVQYPDKFIKFCEILKELTSVKRVDFSEETPGTHRVFRLTSVAKLLTSLPKSLSELRFNSLHIWDISSDVCLALSLLIRRPNLTLLKGLNFHYINMDRLKINKLKMENNYRVLMTALLYSNLFHLEIDTLHSWGRVPDKNVQQIKNSLCTLIIKNTSLNHMVGLEEFATPEVIAALHRNRTLTEITNRLDFSRKKIMQNKAPTQIEAESEIAEIEELVTDAVELLKEWSTLELQSVFNIGRGRLIASLKQYAKVILDKRGILIDEILRLLSPTNSENAAFHFLYFTRTLQDTIAAFTIQNPNIGQVPYPVLRKALLKALPYCLDSNNKLITLNHQDQLIFDCYLSMAAKNEQQEKTTLLSNQTRVHLMKLFLFHEVKSQSISNNRFFSFTKRLPLAFAIHQIETVQEDNTFDQALLNFSACVEDLFQSRLDHSQNTDLFILLYYIKQLNHKFLAQQRVAHCFSQNYSKAGVDIITEFIKLACDCFDEMGNMMVYSQNHLVIFDKLLLYAVFSTSENLNEALSDLQRMALLQIMLLKKWNTVDQNAQTHPHLFIEKLSDLTETIFEQLAKSWKLATHDLEKSVHANHQNENIYRIIIACKQFAIKIKQSKLAEELPRYATQSMPSLSLAEQQINVISQLQEFCIAALKQRCSVTRTERLNGLLLRIHNFFASNPQVSQLTQIQQNDLSNLWNLLKRRLPELGLDEDDNHRELLQSIKDIEKIIDHERDTIKSVVTGDDEVDLAVKRGLFG